MEANDLKAVYDALLSAPGMEQSIRIDLKLDRKTALFLVTAIERGLTTEGNRQGDLLALSTAVTRDELSEISGGILEKAGLSEMHRKLEAFRGK